MPCIADCKVRRQGTAAQDVVAMAKGTASPGAAPQGMHRREELAFRAVSRG